MTHCHTPTKKLQCLIELQQLVIKCIDKYRQEQFIKNSINEDDDQDKKIKQKMLQIMMMMVMMMMME